jgi:hypothetical protein
MSGGEMDVLHTNARDFQDAVKHTVKHYRGEDAVITEADVDNMYFVFKCIRGTYNPAYITQGLIGRKVSDL